MRSPTVMVSCTCGLTGITGLTLPTHSQPAGRASAPPPSGRTQKLSTQVEPWNDDPRAAQSLSIEHCCADGFTSHEQPLKKIPAAKTIVLPARPVSALSRNIENQSFNTASWASDR